MLDCFCVCVCVYWWKWWVKCWKSEWIQEQRWLRTWSWSWGNLQWWSSEKETSQASKETFLIAKDWISFPAQDFLRHFLLPSVSAARAWMSVNGVKSEKESALLDWWRVDLLWSVKCLYLSAGHLPLQKRAANLKQRTGVLDHGDRYSALQHK